MLKEKIFTTLGGEYKAKQTRRRKLGVLPKFQSKNFLKIWEYPSVDDSEGKKRLSVIYCEAVYCSLRFIRSKQCLPLHSKIAEAALSLFCELGTSSQDQFCL